MISSLKTADVPLNSNFTREEAFHKLPLDMQKTIIESKLSSTRLTFGDGQGVGLGGRINMVMQTAFF